jgi:CRP/FNR family cyclic AMP-dependent transcriptional regulator
MFVIRLCEPYHRISAEAPLLVSWPLIEAASWEGFMRSSNAVDLRSKGGQATQAAAPRPWPGNSRFKTQFKREQALDAQAFLDSEGPGRKIAKFRGNETVFSQGSPGTNVMYIQEGGVKLTLVNATGKEAIVEILGPGDFFGIRCLSGHSLNKATATTIMPTTVLVIEKDMMIRVLHAEHDISDRFIANMLARHVRVEEALIDQLFNSGEKRLARTLLLLARYDTQNQPPEVIPKVSQEMLAEMIGTTRSRVNFFMNKFRKLGFIEYDGEIHVNESLLNVLLHD